MLTLQLPTLLALLGAALMTVVIFAPRASSAPVAASCAPPSAPPPLERWAPRCVPDVVPPPPAPDLAPAAAWPALLDPGAAGCDAAARLALVDALGAVRTAWAAAILERALREDVDAAVRHRAAAMLGG